MTQIRRGRNEREESGKAAEELVQAGYWWAGGARQIDPRDPVEVSARGLQVERRAPREREESRITDFSPRGLGIAGWKLVGKGKASVSDGRVCYA